MLSARVCRVFVLLLPITTPAFALDRQPSTQAIIDKCSAIYKGSGHPCPCPFDHTKNGSACGKRSAYDRPEGASPVCFAKDVTPEILKGWLDKSLNLEQRCAYAGR